MDVKVFEKNWTAILERKKERKKENHVKIWEEGRIECRNKQISNRGKKRKACIAIFFLSAITVV